MVIWRTQLLRFGLFVGMVGICFVGKRGFVTCCGVWIGVGCYVRARAEDVTTGGIPESREGNREFADGLFGAGQIGDNSLILPSPMLTFLFQLETVKQTSAG
jgi:hypothetical protein